MDRIGAQTWASLSLYESTELVRRFFNERNDKDPGEVRARDIAAHFSQGREYFRSAAGASELVRPLILYYGAKSLARGTVLFLSQGSTVPSHGHGLKASEWTDLNSHPEAVPELRVKVGSKGTFPALAHVTCNTERAKVRSVDRPSQVTVWSPGTNLEPGTSLGVKEILGQIPEIAELYENTFDEHSRRLRCELEITLIPEQTIQVAVYRNEGIPPDREVRRYARLGLVPTVAGLPQLDWVIEALGRERVLSSETRSRLLHFARDPRHKEVEAHLLNLLYDSGSEENPRLEVPVATLSSGEEYLKLPTHRGVMLSTLLALHLAAYAVGMLVRYQPGYWAMLIGRTKGDAIAPVLSAAISTVEDRYPTLILEAMREAEAEIDS